MPPKQQQQLQGNYDFIMNPGRPPKKSLLPIGSMTPKKLAVLVGLSAVGVLLIILILSMFLGGGGNKEHYLKLAHTQSELARVASLHSSAVNQSTKNAAISTAFAVTSDQKALLAALPNYGVKLSKKELRAPRNKETDARLDAAKAAAAYDETLISILGEQLAAYQDALQQAHANANNKKLKELLNTDYNGTLLLRKQIDAAKF